MTTSATPDPTPAQQTTIDRAARPGWRTSEFWLSIIALVSAIAVPQADTAVSQATHTIAQHGTLGVLAAGAITGAYAVGRSMVKAAAVSAASTPAGPTPPAP